jgi:hypothetical protein
MATRGGDEMLRVDERVVGGCVGWKAVGRVIACVERAIGR